MALGKYIRPGDIIIILVVFLGATAALFIHSVLPSLDPDQELVVVVNAEGQEIQRISLRDIPQEGMSIEVQGPIGIHEIVLRPHQVRVVAPENDPLKICEKTGWISNPGPAIVCVPNRLAIWLESDDSAGLDGISE